MHQTIDIWSLGCVFSIAATWVALGYQGVLQYAEFRKNAIKSCKERNPSHLAADSLEETKSSAENKSIEDCFHDGHGVLPEVTKWHKSLRIILRKTDLLTSLVLDLVDNRMLLSDPTKRLSAEEACLELGKIYDQAELALSDLAEKVPEEITEGLRQLDDSAPAKPLPKTPSQESEPDRHSRNEKSKRLEVPLMKTTHRSEVFKPEPRRISRRLVDIEEFPVPEVAVVDPMSTNAEPALYQDLESRNILGSNPSLASSRAESSQSSERPYSMANSIDRSIYSTPSRRRSPAPPSMLSNKSRAPRQNVFEAREQLDRFFKGMRGKARMALGKLPKDVVLSYHFDNRDLVSSS